MRNVPAADGSTTTLLVGSERPPTGPVAMEIGPAPGVVGAADAFELFAAAAAAEPLLLPKRLLSILARAVLVLEFIWPGDELGSWMTTCDGADGGVDWMLPMGVVGSVDEGPVSGN